MNEYFETPNNKLLNLKKEKSSFLDFYDDDDQPSKLSPKRGISITASPKKKKLKYTTEMQFENFSERKDILQK
jgi:hypothetical protein